MSRLTKLLSAIIGAAMCLSVMGIAAGCGNDTAPEGSVSINFWYDCGLDSQPVYRELVKTYNDTQGIQDGVYVVGTRKTGISISARTQLTGGTPPNVIMISDRVFRAYARDGLFLNLDEFYETAPGAYTEDTIPENMTSRFRISVGTGGAKTVVGAGETLLGVPFGCVPAVLFYNVSYFNGQGIHIISVPEEELDAYNKAHGTNFAPHGYAEYAPGFLTGDAASLSASANLADQQVVKVFNNAIPTNWEEFRNLCKYFTKEYNAASPNARAYGNEWWFANGWSVGGDCIGWDGEKYNFTLTDTSANYIVTAENLVVNGVTYEAGQTVRYEDRINNAQEVTAYADSGSLYELPSQRDALVEFLRMSGSQDSVVDDGKTGYGVAYPERSYRAEGFTQGKSAIALNTFSTFISLERTLGAGVDMAVLYQYREYEGGSVYEKDGREYLKVIGAINQGDTSVYTGEIKAQNGTPIVGNLATQDGTDALVIPAKSDSSEYEAAWKFIRWAAGEDGQRILADTGNRVPNQDSVALSDVFYSLNTEKNYYAAAKMSRTSDDGDWGYFEDGEWVTDWANDFNDKLRIGTQTLSEFLSANEAKAQSACENTSIRIKGWR